MHEPKLRFPGYTKPLKRISCGELFRERKEKGQEHLPILTLSIHTGISDHELDDAESIKKVKRSEDKSLYKRVYPKDLAFNMMRAWQGAFGVSKVDGMISPAYIVAEPIKEINADYLNYYIQTAHFIGAANNLSYGVTDFRKRLYWNSFCKIEMHLPSLEEQKKIAALLVSIDNMIDKQKEMISAWEERKKGVMQKLFSQEVRFKADDGSEFPDWEEKKLGECCSIKTGKLDASAAKENGTYKFFTCAREDSLIDTYSFEGIAILIAGNGDVGHTKIYDGKFDAYQRTYVLQHFTENPYYLKTVIDMYLPRRIASELQKGAMPYIKLRTLADLIVPYPINKDEQQKIADCLSSLDEVIEKQKAALAAWEELKKGLLQQMFV